MELIFILFLLFNFKHLIVDFLWQPSYEYLNKGTYGHWGGIRHSLKHVFVTLLILSSIDLYTNYNIDNKIAAYAVLIEFLTHYHIDWAKMNINKFYGWTATTSENFWRLVGLDQFLHSVVYILMIWMVV